MSTNVKFSKSAIWNVQINGCDIYVNKGHTVLKSVTQVQTKPDAPSLDSISEFDTYWPRRLVSCDESKAPSTPPRRNLKDGELHSEQLFFVLTVPGKFKTTTWITGHFGFVFEKTHLRRSLDAIVFEKLGFLKCFPSTWKEESRRFQIPPAWRALSKSSVFVAD